jgi:hypothetical protein
MPRKPKKQLNTSSSPAPRVRRRKNSGRDITAEPLGIKAEDVRLRKAYGALMRVLEVLEVSFADCPTGQDTWIAWQAAEEKRRVDEWNGWYKTGPQYRLTVGDVQRIREVVLDLANAVSKNQPVTLIRGYLEASDHSAEAAGTRRGKAKRAAAEAIEAWCEHCVGSDTTARRSSRQRVAYKLTQQLQLLDPKAFALLSVEDVLARLKKISTPGRSASKLVESIASDCGAWPHVTAKQIDAAK